MDLQSRNSIISRLLHHLEHELCHGIILYDKHLRPQIAKPHQQKAFAANNTLNLSRYDALHTDQAATLRKYGITTKKNIICVGRIQKRKRIDDLYPEMQFVQQLMIFPFIYSFLKLSRSPFSLEFIMQSALKKVIRYTSGITLELYMAHSMLSLVFIKVDLSFPINIILFLPMSISAAVLIKVIADKFIRNQLLPIT